MGARLRLTLIFIGALLVVATFTYPLWRVPPAAPDSIEVVFAELTETEQERFNTLPRSVQQAYIAMRQENEIMALDLLAARLRDPVELPQDQQAAPDLETAVIIAQGEFAPVQLDDFDEREPQPYSQLYEGTVGTVTVYQYPDNSKLLRIENLGVINGPNLRVLLSTVADPVTREEIEQDRLSLDLGPLVANVGAVNFRSVPVEIDIRNYRSVVIYDRTYGIIFGVAQLV